MGFRTGPIFGRPPKGFEPIPGRQGFCSVHTRSQIAEGLSTGFYVEPRKLAACFSPMELDRLKELSWFDLSDDRPVEYQYSAIFLRPFLYDDQMFSVPSQLLRCFGRKRFIDYYTSPYAADGQRVRLGLADCDIPESTPSEEALSGLDDTLRGQAVYLNTLYLIGEIEDHLSRITGRVVDFRIMRNSKHDGVTNAFKAIFSGGWKASVRRAIQKMDTVFVVPSFHDGTLWEIDELAKDEKLLRKTWFVVPLILDADVTLVTAYWRRTFKALSRRLIIPFDLYEPGTTDETYLTMLEMTVWRVDEGRTFQRAADLHFWCPPLVSGRGQVSVWPQSSDAG